MPTAPCRFPGNIRANSSWIPLKTGFLFPEIILRWGISSLSRCGSFNMRRQQVDRQRICGALREDYRPLDGVFELANVAGPAVGAQAVPRGLGHALDLPAVLLVVLVEEVPHERG